MTACTRKSLGLFGAALAVLAGMCGLARPDADAPKLPTVGHAKVLYSSYLAEGVHASARAVAVDPAGHIYVAGVTTSPSFPVTHGALRTTFPHRTELEGYVMKLSDDGSRVLYSTFFGGPGGAEVDAIAVDRRGDAFIGGETDSPGLSTTGEGQEGTVDGPLAGFVAELAPNGHRLIYSTYLGKTHEEEGFAGVNAIAIDSAGNAYVTGATENKDFPITPGAAQTDPEIPPNPYLDWTAFATKLNPRGARVYSTFIGGHMFDEGTAIAVDKAGDAFITGRTESRDFPVTPRALQSHKKANEFGIVFVTKLNPKGTKFDYSTYLGGNGIDEPKGVAVDRGGDAYVAGQAADQNFPTTPGAAKRHTRAFESSFVSVISPDGRKLLHSTLFGGESQARGLALDPSGDVFIVGNQRTTVREAGSGQGFLAELTPNLSKVRLHIPLGAKESSAAKVAIGPSGDLYVVGGSGPGLPKRNAITFGDLRKPPPKFSSAFVERVRP